jgi:hypothetical protein
VTAAVICCASVVIAQDPDNEDIEQSRAHGAAALQHLHDNQIDLALDSLGHAADLLLPAKPDEDDGLSAATGALHRVLTQLDAEERFQVLYKWSMPTDMRKGVRLLTTLVPQAAPPKAFARVLGERPRDESFAVSTIGHVRGLFSSGWSLVQAANEVGRLRRLTTELEQLKSEKVSNADVLLLLARIANNRGEPSTLKESLEQRVSTIRKAMPKPGEQLPEAAVIDPSDIVLAAAALTREALRPLSARMFKALIELTYDRPAWRLRPFLRVAHATAVQMSRGESGPEAVHNSRLKYWVSTSGRTSALNAMGAVDAVWVVHEDHILHLAGARNDVLFLRYPLTGDFEFTCETQEGGRIETDGGLVYGGLQFEARGATKQLRIWDADIAHSVQKPCPFVRHENRPTFNRVSIRSTDKGATFLANRHPVWRNDAAAKQSPWLGLRSFDERRPMFRNLKITGNPVIPREVRLSDGNHLRGWQSHFFGETQAAFAKGSTVNPLSRSIDWSVNSGIVSTTERKPIQGLLRYQRPLLDGESISYEFHYEQGEFEVHPALGRMAFLMERGGVRVRWITDGTREWTGLPANNALLEALNRRGPRRLPLKENDWNTVTLARRDDKVAVSLNDTTIFERSIDFAGDHLFGFYLDRRTSRARIRNVVMTGDWPATLPDEFIDNPAMADDGDKVAADQQAMNDLCNDEFIAENVRWVRSRVEKMPAGERFAFLAHWVLPSPGRPRFRVSGEFARDGEIVSPVFDLLDVAGELESLNELRQQVTEISATADKLQKRSRAALLLLIALELGDPKAASKATDELYSLLLKAKPIGVEDRWPETLAAYRAVDRFSTSPVVADMVGHLFAQRAQPSSSPGIIHWHSQMAALMGRWRLLERQRQPKGSGFTSELTNWIPVVRTGATSRGRGIGQAVWKWNGDTVEHFPGHNDDYLFYRSPLLGDFEVECDIGPNGTTQILAGGTFGGPQTMDRFEAGTFRGRHTLHPIAPPLTHVDDFARYRAVIRGRICTTFLNGREVYREQLEEHRDPWIAARSWWRNPARVRDLRIIGQPSIPQAVEMSASKSLAGWVPYYRESIGAERAAWRFADDRGSIGRIVGRRRRWLSGTFCESLLQYQRPLVEDGSIEYEFYYEPDNAQTHPALDRLAFLLEPQGVQIHRVSATRFDSGDLPPDNFVDEPDNRRGPDPTPLKASAWNDMKVTLVGSRVTLTLNCQPIYEGELESTNSRTFGLFHYAETEVNVRNVVMRGEWPKTLPSTADQELADQTVNELDAALPKLTSVFVHDFQKDGMPDEYFKPLAAPERFRPNADGLFVSQSTNDVLRNATFSPRFSLHGDFDIVVAFDRLDIMTTGTEGTAQLIIRPNDDQRHDVRVIRGLTAIGQEFIKGQHSKLPAGSNRDEERRYIDHILTSEANAGRLRIARRGKRILTLLAEADSQTFRVIGAEAASDREVSLDGIWLEVVAWGAGRVSVIWKEITLRAERIKYMPPARLETGLYVMNAAGGKPRLLTKPPHGLTHVGSPEWSSDGQTIAFDASRGGGASTRSYLVSVDGTELRQVGLGCMPSLSPDGKRLVFSQPGQGIMMINADGTNREVIEGRGWGTQWSPDGKLIAWGQAGNIIVMDAKTKKRRPLLVGDHATQFNYIFWNLGWSHDSRSIAFKARNQETGGEDIVVADVDSPDGFNVLLASSTGIREDFSFSPDNKRVLFAMHDPAQQRSRFYTVARDGNAPPTPLPGQPPDMSTRDSAWSPDGKRILFAGEKIRQPVDWPITDER